MIYDNTKIVGEIKEFLQKKLLEKGYDNAVIPIRDDVFEILRKECALLYYPLEDDKVKGCHTERKVGENTRQLVFINTSKKIEEQTWTAAHELGHVWHVEKKVKSFEEISSEDIVNRFAAELLLPEELFEKSFKRVIEELNVDEENLLLSEFIHIITFLMNDFCAPYKAIIRRFVELGKIERGNEEDYINRFKKNIEYHELLQKKYYYTRIGKDKKACNMEHIEDDIEKLLSNDIISKKRAQNLKKSFKIPDKQKSSDVFVIGG